MDIGAHSRPARDAARGLLDGVESRYPGFTEVVRTGDARAAAERLGITVHVLSTDIAGCSVAGSCDPDLRTVAITRASPARMRFTALHEIAHVEGANDVEFQQALLRAGFRTRDLEEDACEAFAAALILPDAQVDTLLDIHGRTARGLLELTRAMPQASKEACAVALAHRLASPGYVVIVEASGALRFAARSGAELPLRRGIDQTDSELRPVLRGSPMFRDVGRLCFARGSYTNQMYMDVVGDGELIYAVAVADSPDWTGGYRSDRSSVKDGRIDGWCDQCAVEFTATTRCVDCGEPVHPDCRSCACPPPPARGSRMCIKCFVVQPGPSFPDPHVDVCDAH